MSRRPRVSVVIPAWNAAEWIGATLQSVFQQTCPAGLLEVVLVDDGSSDGTADEAARLLAASGITHVLLRNAAPTGPSAARNRGWRRASGEWIQFLDADDLLAPSKIADQLLSLEESDEGVAGLYSPWARLIVHDGAWSLQQPWSDPVIGEDPLLDLLRAEGFIQLGSALFSRVWLARIGGFNEAYRFIEDVDLLIRLVVAGGALQRVPATEPLSLYRQRPGSLSQSHARAFVEGCLRNARRVEQHWGARGELTSERTGILADIYFFGMRYYGQHDLSAFHALAADIRRLKPDFTPDYPPALRALARVVGYAKAERCAIRWRQLRRAFPMAAPRALASQ